MLHPTIVGCGSEVEQILVLLPELLGPPAGMDEILVDCSLESRVSLETLVLSEKERCDGVEGSAVCARRGTVGVAILQITLRGS